MIYLVFFGVLFISLILMGVFVNKRKLLFEHILTYILMAVFAVRYFSYTEVQGIDENFSIYAYFGGTMSTPLNILGNFAIWFELTALLILFLRPNYHFKTMKWYAKFIASPIFLVCSFSMLPMLEMMQGNTNYSLTYFMLPIEIALGVSISLYYWFKDYKVKISKHSYGEVTTVSILLNFATMPASFPMFVFGLGSIYNHPINFSMSHRMFIYLFLILLPFTLYFGLRKAHKDKIEAALIFIAVGTSIGYFYYSKYDVLMYPWGWPFHLCNMAMIIIPICLIFKLKKLFYFTYFINVFGAALAMLMPDYSSTSTLFNPHIVLFWYNHVIACVMPLLCVALHLFDRPKLKQYFFSSLAFLGYFITVLILNPLFTAFDHPTDFFFINSLFIADKLGEWAKNIFRISFTFTINEKQFTFHPIYQAIYFIVYVLVGFGMWFIYQLGFDISDRHYALHLKLKGIRLDQIALKSVLNGRSISEPMEGNVGIKLELKDFSKKYGLSKHYAVKDANLEVNGGEVFGFLGPNGAGKSTIIKSIVGIQPITSGEIYVCGYNVKSQPVYAKSLIGFVPDHYALYEKLTGREYLNYIADIYEVSKEDRDARLAKYIELFELKDNIDNKIKTYSHGMKQKVTIIAALIHNPKVWILDEPLTGLDPTSIFQVKECMRRHAEEGNIVFFSSHLIDIVEKLCDRIAIIKHGHIECVYTLEEIEKSGKTLEEFYMEKIGNNEDDPRLKD